MTKPTAESRRTEALRNARNLRFCADVEKDPATRKELERQWSAALDALEFAEREWRRALESEGRAAE